MKVAVECKSPLLQKSLELFLVKHLSSPKHCDILIRDIKCFGDKRCFYISSDTDADLVKPFSKSGLILALEKRYKSLNDSESDAPLDAKDGLDFAILEKRIDSLTEEYKQNILKAVRAFYEK